MNRGHEIELNAIAIANNAIDIRRRIVRPKQNAAKILRQIFQFGNVPRRLPEEKIQIDRGDGSTLQRGCGVPDQDGLEMMPFQQPPDFHEQGLRIHRPPVYADRGRVGPLSLDRMPLMASTASIFRVTPELLDEIVRRIRQVGTPERIVLFGSRARGDAHQDSDLDLLIIEDSDLPRYRRAPRYLRALIGVFPAKDVVVWTPAEVEAWRNVPNAFITTALRDGRTLYQR